MPVRVLIVDDSSFFRRQISRLLATDPQIEVVGTAANGREAIEQAKQLKPDAITMDVSMPVMDGISATREIMRQVPTPILMFSSLTTEGAQSTLEALDAGAVDFLPKQLRDIAANKDEVRTVLCERVKVIARRRRLALVRQARGVPVTGTGQARESVPKAGKGLKLLAIGTSTGGPLALQTVLTPLPGDFPLPILLIQHMPGTFTPAFAKRLDQLCQIQVREAQDGDTLERGVAYLAPGGKQMTVAKRGGRLVLRVEAGDPELTYKPSVDVTFASIAEHVPGETLAIVLTGMGSDGCKGAKLLHKGGSRIWAQDEATSVVYGMPAAVNEAGIAERVLPLHEIAAQIMRQL